MSSWYCAFRALVQVGLGCLVWAIPGPVTADFVFNVVQRTQLDRFEVGTTAIFDVTLARAPGFPSVNNLAGISFFVGLGDPAGWGTTHPAGILGSGTNDSTSLLAGGRNYLFNASEGGGFLNDGSDFLAFSVSTTTERPVSTTPVFLGSFILNTAGGTAGDYTLRFAANEFGLQDGASNLLPGNYIGQPLSFTTVTVVPEPNSWLLAALAITVFSKRISWRRRGMLLHVVSGGLNSEGDPPSGLADGR